MTFIEVLLLAIGLCFDTLAVSMIGGACIKKFDFWKVFKILFFMAFFQAGFTFLGWALGATVEQYIEKFDHWVAFALLAYIGGNMIKDAFSKEEEDNNVDLLSTGKLIISSIATSIDAFAVGISMAMVQTTMSEILYYVLVIGLVTAAAAGAGLFGGDRLGKILGSKCNLIGGLILIGIGIKILAEHLFF